MSGLCAGPPEDQVRQGYIEIRVRDGNLTFFRRASRLRDRQRQDIVRAGSLDGRGFGPERGLQLEREGFERGRDDVMPGLGEVLRIEPGDIGFAWLLLVITGVAGRKPC